jgi:penicillin-binding protein 1B
VAFPDVQVALIAIDPRTAEIKALVGGRNYGVSQLNHIRPNAAGFDLQAIRLRCRHEHRHHSRRPRGADAGLQSHGRADHVLVRRQAIRAQEFHQKFIGGSLFGSPRSFHQCRRGEVAEQVGYQTVVDLAKNAGMNLNVHATPSVALAPTR